MTLNVSFTTLILWIYYFFISVNFTRKSQLSHFPFMLSPQFGPFYLCKSSIFAITLQWHYPSEISRRSPCCIIKKARSFTDDQGPHLQYSFKSRVPSLIQSILLINSLGTSAMSTFNVLCFFFILLHTHLYKCPFISAIYIYPVVMIHMPFHRLHNGLKNNIKQTMFFCISLQRSRVDSVNLSCPMHNYKCVFKWCSNTS